MGIEPAARQQQIQRDDPVKTRRITDASEWESLDGDDGDADYALAHDMGAFLREDRGGPAGSTDD